MGSLQPIEGGPLFPQMVPLKGTTVTPTPWDGTYFFNQYQTDGSQLLAWLGDYTKKPPTGYYGDLVEWEKNNIHEEGQRKYAIEELKFYVSEAIDLLSQKPPDKDNALGILFGGPGHFPEDPPPPGLLSPPRASAAYWAIWLRDN